MLTKGSWNLGLFVLVAMLLVLLGGPLAALVSPQGPLLAQDASVDKTQAAKTPPSAKTAPSTPGKQKTVADETNATSDLKALADADKILAKKPDKTTQDEPQDQESEQPNNLRLYDLILKGGPLMYPIAIMLAVVILFTLERALALRRVKVLPQSLIDELDQLSQEPDGFDPRKAYRICQNHRSAAARVIRAMLLKVGRPHAEVEHAVRDASEREAGRLYSNVRTLNLAAAISPLLGLLGTVWGMIRAFFDLGNLDPGVNKSDALAEGIYVALVTTFAGLCVAIPAAIIAHLYEGRIQSLFRQIDDLLFSLLPQVEQFEGKIRVSRKSGNLSDIVRTTPPDDSKESKAAKPPPPPTATPPVPADAPDT